MADWTIRRYRPEDAWEWDEFVRASRNGTFLFLRGFMDYHSDRFTDHSLMAFKGGRLLAMLPADITPDRWLHSHRGLTYGGWITSVRHFDANDMLGLFEAWIAYCRTEEISCIDYKPVPWIYPPTPAQEDIYALFRFGAIMTECNLSTALVPGVSPGFNTLQKRNLRKGLSLNAEFDDNVSPEEFHALLCDCLEERHGVAPVHSLSELRLLIGRFPEHIRIYGCRTMLHGLEAGVCIFQDRGVAHCQYIASSGFGRDNGLLTALFYHLIYDVYSSVRYFDFGTSNEDRSLYLNPGLLRQKASLGGTGVTYQRFTLRLNGHD